MTKAELDAKLKELLPGITAKERKALAAAKPDDVKEIIADLKVAGKVNQSDFDKLMAFAKDLEPVAKLLMGLLA